MKISVNNDIIETGENTSVEKLIEFLDFQQYQLAVAINNQVIPKMKWQRTFLHENDNVIIIKAVSGG
jgi:sulfur carrier protein